MNTGQIMMVIFAFAMLSTLALAVNGAITTTLTVTFESELALNAHSIAQSLLDEIMSNEFDEKTVGGVRVYSRGEMTATGALGTDAGEALPGGLGSFDVLDSVKQSFHSQRKFDDVDDFRDYRRRVRNLLGWQFEARTTVEYVMEADPNQPSTPQTYIKRITVSVTNPNMAKDDSSNVIPVVMRDLAIYRRYY